MASLAVDGFDMVSELIRKRAPFVVVRKKSPSAVKDVARKKKFDVAVLEGELTSETPNLAEQLAEFTRELAAYRAVYLD